MSDETTKDEMTEGEPGGWYGLYRELRIPAPIQQDVAGPADRLFPARRDAIGASEVASVQ